MQIARLLKSKRYWIALIIFIGLFFIKHNPILVCGISFMLAYLYNPQTIRPLKNYKFWIVIIMLIVIVPLFTGIPDRSIFGINYSSTQFEKTLRMTLRGISIFLLFQVLTTNLQIDNIKPFFRKIGIKNFDILFNLSNEIFPKIKGILLARYSLFREDWKSSKSVETILNFIVDIFNDFFNLIDQLDSDESNVVQHPRELFEQLDVNNNLVIIVGDAGAGKTLWIEKFIDILKVNNLVFDGLISEKVIEPDDKWHHDLIQVASRKRKPLTSMNEIASKLKVGKFYMYEESIAWGNKHLKSLKKN